MNTVARVIVVVLIVAFAGYGVMALGLGGDERKPDEILAQREASRAERLSNKGGDPTVEKVGQRNQPALSPKLSDVHPHDQLHLIDKGLFAPLFKEKNASGKTLSLKDYKGEKNLIIVFYQGFFCPVCGAQLEDLQSNYDAFKEQDTEIIGVSADDLAHAQQTVGERGLAFPIIPDKDKSMIEQFGVANVVRANIAYPSVYVVNKEGRVEYAFADKEGTRLKTKELLPIVTELNNKTEEAS